MEVDEVLREYGFEIQLKDEQMSIINSILKQEDTIAILPTGFGKSMCYVIPPLMCDKNDPSKRHTSLVISPLKSLMLDQVKTLRERNIAAYCLVQDADQDEVEGIKRGLCSLLFASPEAVLIKYWRDVIDNVYKDRICLVAYDEAHCISEWGLDFRPDYGKVGILQSLIEAPVLVLSATITQDIRKDIDKALGLVPRKTRVISTLPNRPNIFLCTEKSSENFEVELLWIVQALKNKKEMCPKIIVYVNSISLCDAIYIWMHTELKSEAYKGEVEIDKRMVEMYHAHTDSESKTRIMDQFCTDSSVLRVLIATVACGMGVNIPDIEFVVLWGLPTSLLIMWQEAGRCGRDGRHGICLCYAFQRSISKPCDMCRKERKFQCKCTSREYTRALVSTEECQRIHVLKHFLIEGMDKELLPSCTDSPCDSNCESCLCFKCKCCIVCMKTCKCSKNISREKLIERFLK